MAVPEAWFGAAGPGQEGGRSLWGKAHPRGPPVPWGSAVLRAHTVLPVPPALGCLPLGGSRAPTPLLGQL